MFRQSMKKRGEREFSTKITLLRIRERIVSSVESHNPFLNCVAITYRFVKKQLSVQPLRVFWPPIIVSPATVFPSP